MNALGALALGLAVAQATPTPPPQIIDVRSRALCRTLHENVAPAVAALLQNQAALLESASVFKKMGKDLVAHSASLAMDRLALENEVSRLARNIDVADTLLADARRFPASPSSADESLAAQAKRELQQVVDEQKAMLNVVNGTLETDALGEMMQLPDEAKAAAGSSDTIRQGQSASQPAPQGSTAPAQTAGLAPGPGIDPRTLGTTDLFGQTFYARIAAALDASNARAGKAQRGAAQTVAAIAAECGK